jgi:hypothetical protein
MNNRLKRTSAWLRTGAILLALLGILPAVSHAGEYVLERGNDEPVCTQFAKNLRLLEADPERLNNVCPIAAAEGLRWALSGFHAGR